MTPQAMTFDGRHMWVPALVSTLAPTTAITPYAGDSPHHPRSHNPYDYYEVLV